MKFIIIVFGALFVFNACQIREDNQESASDDDLTILEKVANAHGFEAWKDVKEIEFTFNVDRDTVHFERNWKWNKKTNEVSVTRLGETISYNRKNIDTSQTATDEGFINDKFWLLAPFQLIWDSSNFSYSFQEKVMAPISKTKMHKLTIVYGPNGGYTPGDAYDFYFLDDFLLKEWVFRQGNQADASMTTTWEEYLNVNGLKIAKSHKTEDANFNLYFTGIEIK